MMACSKALKKSRISYAKVTTVFARCNYQLKRFTKMNQQQQITNIRASAA